MVPHIPKHTHVRKYIRAVSAWVQKERPNLETARVWRQTIDHAVYHHLPHTKLLQKRIDTHYFV